ncbi:hypothetical protein HK102_011305, partial [Quaeritorhiza haematococci]
YYWALFDGPRYLNTVREVCGPTFFDDYNMTSATSSTTAVAPSAATMTTRL